MTMMVDWAENTNLHTTCLLTDLLTVKHQLTYLLTYLLLLQVMAVPGQTVEELVHHWSQVDPDIEAFVSLSPSTWERRVLTRHEVHVLARKFAAWLRQQGVGKGEVVCVALPNCLERVVADLGTICSGAVALNGQVFRADGEDFLQVSMGRGTL